MSEILKMLGITKVYPNGIVANDKVDFIVNSGEIHALVGENGAGKTTLMNVLFGFQQPEEGEIYYKGKKINITSPLAAIEKGIGMVHQHFMLANSLTVAENIVLGMEPRRGLSFDFQESIKMTKVVAEKYNLPVEPEAKIEDIPVGMRQKVEILKALLRGAELLVLDEPTAVLTPQETEELFESLLVLKEQGHTIIFITHKLREVKEISDRVTVMRKGKVIGVRKTAEVTEQDISRMMVGRDVTFKVEKPEAQRGDIVLEVKDLISYNNAGKKIINDVSFNVREGEIVGIAGVEGNGQSELIEILTGLRRAHGGQVLVDGTDITNTDPKTIRNNRVSHIPEDRMIFGVAKDATIEQNLISDRYDKPEFNKGILTDQKRIAKEAETLVKDFDIRTRSPKTQVRMLSGGNIQKVVVARELSSNPRLVIANQPTRGVDVGAIEFIHQQLVEMSRKSVAVLLVSADLNEVMSLSDRLLVMYEGEIVAAFPDPDKISERELGLYMLGVERQDDQKLKEALK